MRQVTLEQLQRNKSLDAVSLIQNSIINDDWATYIRDAMQRQRHCLLFDLIFIPSEDEFLKIKYHGIQQPLTKTRTKK